MTNDQRARSAWRRTDERAEHKLFTQINVGARRYSSLALKGQESLMVLISRDRPSLIDAISPFGALWTEIARFTLPALM